MGHAAGEPADRLQALGLGQGGLGVVAFLEDGGHALVQQIVDAQKVALGLFDVGDIEGDADVAAEGAPRAEARLGEGPYPAPVAVGPAEPCLMHVRLVGGFGGRLFLGDMLRVVGVQQVLPVIGDGLVVGDAEELDIGGVGELPLAVRPGDPHGRRCAVGEGAEARLAFLQGLHGLAAVGDVDVDAQGAERAAVLIAESLTAREQPAGLAVRPDDPVFQRLHRAVAHGAGVHAAHVVAVVGMGQLDQALAGGRLRRIKAKGAVDRR